METHFLNRTFKFSFYALCLISFSWHVKAQACADYRIVSPLHEQTQYFSDWCTAASVRVVTARYGSTLSQCELVGRAVGRNCCPPSEHTPGNDALCHPPGIWPPAILTKTKYTFASLDYLADSPTGPPSWETIVNEICSDRPMLSVASLTELNNLHTVVVEGFRREVVDLGELHKVRIFDPQDDLCELDCSQNDQNPRFLTEDHFYHSGYDHHTDHIRIVPLTGFDRGLVPGSLEFEIR